MVSAGIRTIVLLTALWAVGAGSAFAQDATVVSPSAGALASIAMEQVGYKSQSMVLKDLKDFLDTYAVLLWVVAAATAFAIAAVYGSFEQVIWLIFGPALFLFMLRTTEVGRAIEWRTDVPALSSTTLFAPDPNVPLDVEVSWFFKKYNNFISSISRELIKILTGDDSLKIKEKFFNRGDVMSAILQTTIKDGGFNSFLTEGVTQCKEVLTAANEVATGNKDPVYRGSAAYLKAKALYDSNFSQTTRQLENTVGKKYLYELFTAAQANGGTFPTIAGGKSSTGSTSLLDQCGQRTLQRMSDSGGVDVVLNGLVSCEEIWCWMGLGVQWEVAQANDIQTAKSGVRQSTYQEILDEVAVKFAEPKVVAVPGSPLAPPSLVQPDTSVIPVILLGYLMRDRLQNDQLGGDVMAMMQRAGYTQERFDFDPKTLTDDQVRWVTQKNSQEIIAEVKKFELIQFMMMIPYLQGFILYALGLTFPFFALYLLVPGKASNFVTWMMLWAWAKSWDVGWALVMIVDDFLWQMMPHSAKFDPTIDPNFTPVTIFETAFRNDPSYSIATYYIILATLTSSVPMFSAQIMLGAKAGMVTPLVKGISGFASQFSMGISHYVASKQGLGTIRLREAWIQKEGQNFSNLSQEQKIAALKNPENQKMARQAWNNVQRMRGLADEFRRTPSNSSMAGISFLNPTGKAIEQLAPAEAALQADRIANSMEADFNAFSMNLKNSELNYTQEHAVFYQIYGTSTNRSGAYWETFDMPTEQKKQLVAETKTIDNYITSSREALKQRVNVGVGR